MRLRILLGILLWVGASTGFAQERSDPSFLVIVIDGLRPDYVTPEIMPHLHGIGAEGMVFKNHHSVFPTVTRVNSASISTGSYPATHGLMGNAVYFPNVERQKALNTSDANNLIRISEVEGTLLSAETLGEVLEKNGKSILAVSSGSSGSAMLLNHTLAGGGVINVDMILPEGNQESVVDLIGPAPGDALPALERNAWVVDAYLKVGLDRQHATVTMMWLTDPDHTAHSAGIGSPLTLEALTGVDGEIGRILAGIRERGLGDRVNILVTSDHGFSTHTGGFNLFGLLRKHGLQKGVTLAGGAIYTDGRQQGQVREIVELLQKTEWVGAIFTAPQNPGSALGGIAGTLSLDLVQWMHARSADILVSPNWTDDENEHGYRGTTTLSGTAGHGSSSPYDIHNTLIAFGPAFKSQTSSKVPTSNTDIAPTILHLLGIDSPDTMTGRPILEGLVNGPAPALVAVQEHNFRVKTKAYGLTLSESEVDGRRYLNFTQVER